MECGVINLGTKFANEIGFTKDKFSGYLWRIDKVIYISLIVSLKKGKGNFSKLIENLLTKGYLIKIPTPSSEMKNILINKNFKREIEKQDISYDPEIYCLIEEVEVWVKHPLEVSAEQSTD
jgi:hypothetical protein